MFTASGARGYCWKPCRDGWCSSQCCIYNGNKSHRGTTISTWSLHSLLLLAYVYSWMSNYFNIWWLKPPAARVIDAAVNVVFAKNNKPHKATTIWTWYRHSVLLLSIVYSCTFLTISRFGDCSHHHQVPPPLVWPWMRPSFMFNQQLHLLHKKPNPLCHSLSLRWDVHEWTIVSCNVH